MSERSGRGCHRAQGGMVLSLCRGVRVGFSFGDVPGQEAPERDVLDHHAFSEDFRLDRTVSKFARKPQPVHRRARKKEDEHVPRTF